ncbi:MAG: PAS domain-containing protein [Polyangiaceae bacterium]|nr:PAS domain-containing protein [Polyangiaceae bacterium]
MANDDSSRKNDAQPARFLEDRFFALSLDLLCIAGTDGYFKFVNPAWERKLGFSKEELMSRPAVEFVHPDDRAATRQLAAPLRRGENIVQFQNRYLCKDGSVRWISWVCTAVHEGENFLYAIGRDVTDQRTAEEGLSRKTAELEAIFRALPDLLFRTDEAGRIVDYSAGRMADLYAPPSTFLGKTFAEVLPAPLGAAITALVEAAHHGRDMQSMEYELDVPSGKQRFEARVVPFLDGQTITVARNVTDRWLAEEALKVSEERLRESERLEAVGRLAGGIAHDFNNLMMVVLMYSDALLRKLDRESAHRRELLEIRDAGERAARLTKQLLAFARKQILSPTVLNPRLVLSDMEAMLRGLIGEHIALRCTYEEEVFSVRADRSQLEQVVLNLALNARDAMPRGGELRIELANEEVGDDDARRLDLARHGSYVRLRVSDTGCGIDPQSRPHIFEPFFTTKGAGNGTGLGLATVYGIVRQSGGSVAVETEPGKGASFTILLPSAPSPKVDSLPPHPGEMPGGSETVLIVEDEPAVRNALADALRRLGYTTLEAERGDLALELAASHAGSIDLLLTDIVMPGISGPELATKLLAVRPRIKLLYMSGYPLATGALPEPTGPILQKPFQPRTLAQSVRDALDVPGAADDSIAARAS